MPSINVVSKDGRINYFPITKDEVTIGRGKDNDIVLLDNTSSRNHARIVKTAAGYQLTDLGSFNGTQVNKDSIQNAILKHNDMIVIGFSKLTFLTTERVEPSITESVTIESEDGDQKILQSSPYAESVSGELLVSVEALDNLTKKNRSAPKAAQSQSLKLSDLSNLERSNKVLFVLYEISKHLNSISDFNELLNKIMDLIFVVIDADYGFLILTGDQDEDELIPVVVKCKDNQAKKRGDLKASKTIVNKVIHDKVALLTSNAMADTRLDHGKSLFLHKIRSAMCVPLWKKDQIIGVIQLDSMRAEGHFDENDLQLLKTIGSQMAMIIEQASLNEQIREEERMRNRLERFHSPQIISLILKSGQEAKDNIMEPKDLTATILFADIIGFTRLSEQMPPREINMILNQFFSRMTDIIFEYDGTLDKYMGDGLMAVFGAPMEKEGDAERAIIAALKMKDALVMMMDEAIGVEQFQMRIGINTGRVVAGNIGSPKRMDYTVIGDPVNIASRLESIAGPNQILIGEETYKHIGEKFQINEIGLRQVKGKSSEVMVYEVIGQK
ncbi:adenylate/guanylate cyclase domain-containing protein [Thermodesulfobacteriota bacterium]